MKAIKVPLESFLYLSKEQRKQRIGDELSQKAIERITKNFEKYYEKGRTLTSGDLGGSINGVWTSWSLEEMKDMLRKQHLSFEECEDKRISIAL